MEDVQDEGEEFGGFGGGDAAGPPEIDNGFAEMAPHAGVRLVDPVPGTDELGLRDADADAIFDAEFAAGDRDEVGDDGELALGEREAEALHELGGEHKEACRC